LLSVVSILLSKRSASSWTRERPGFLRGISRARDVLDVDRLSIDCRWAVSY
jgi:hypothetical protein